MNPIRVPKTQVKNLVFKGGSVKGIAYLGCLKALQELDPKILPGVLRVIGTSAGAITALFVALNLCDNEKELRDYLSQDFTEFLDMEDKSLQNRLQNFSESNLSKQGMTVSSASSTFSSMGTEKLGFASGINFRDWIDEIVFKKTNIKNCTFAELSRSGTYKLLYVVSFDLTDKSTVVFSNDETPDAIISDAIRSSISIPYIFEPHNFYFKSLDNQRYVPENKVGHKLIDGGIALNFPMQILHEKANSNEILGFYLTTPKVAKNHLRKYPPRKANELEESNYEALYKYKESSSSDNISRLAYSKQIYNNYKKYKGQGSKHDKLEREYDRTIYINNCNVSSLKFNLDDVTKEQLIAEGERAVKEYFEGKTFTSVVNPSRACCKVV